MACPVTPISGWSTEENRLPVTMGTAEVHTIAQRQTSENAGLYRHPHIALAALEIWIANQCMPKKCPSTWLDSPNGQDYATDDTTSTSIT